VTITFKGVLLPVEAGVGGGASAALALSASGYLTCFLRVVFGILFIAFKFASTFTFTGAHRSFRHADHHTHLRSSSISPTPLIVRPVNLVCTGQQRYTTHRAPASCSCGLSWDLRITASMSRDFLFATPTSRNRRSLQEGPFPMQQSHLGCLKRPNLDLFYCWHLKSRYWPSGQSGSKGRRSERCPRGSAVPPEYSAHVNAVFCP
jgi:hypothetical protein